MEAEQFHPEPDGVPASISPPGSESVIRIVVGWISGAGLAAATPPVNR